MSSKSQKLIGYESEGRITEKIGFVYFLDVSYNEEDDRLEVDLNSYLKENDRPDRVEAGGSYTIEDGSNLVGRWRSLLESLEPFEDFSLNQVDRIEEMLENEDADFGPEFCPNNSTYRSGDYQDGEDSRHSLTVRPALRGEETGGWISDPSTGKRDPFNVRFEGIEPSGIYEDLLGLSDARRVNMASGIAAEQARQYPEELRSANQDTLRMLSIPTSETDTVEVNPGSEYLIFGVNLEPAGTVPVPMDMKEKEDIARFLDSHDPEYALVMKGGQKSLHLDNFEEISKNETTGISGMPEDMATKDMSRLFQSIESHQDRKVLIDRKNTYPRQEDSVVGAVNSNSESNEIVNLGGALISSEKFEEVKRWSGGELI